MTAALDEENMHRIAMHMGDGDGIHDEGDNPVLSATSRRSSSSSSSSNSSAARKTTYWGHLIDAAREAARAQEHSEKRTLASDAMELGAGALLREVASAGHRLEQCIAEAGATGMDLSSDASTNLLLGAGRSGRGAEIDASGVGSAAGSDAEAPRRGVPLAGTAAQAVELAGQMIRLVYTESAGSIAGEVSGVSAFDVAASQASGRARAAPSQRLQQLADSLALACERLEGAAERQQSDQSPMRDTTTEATATTVSPLAAAAKACKSAAVPICDTARQLLKLEHSRVAESVSECKSIQFAAQGLAGIVNEPSSEFFQDYSKAIEGLGTSLR